MSALEDAQRAEAEARMDLLAHFTGNPEDEFDTECEPLNFFTEAVRHTERVRAEALDTDEFGQAGYSARVAAVAGAAEDSRYRWWFTQGWHAALAAYREPIPGA